MFGENPLMFTQVIIRKQKTNGRTYNRRRTDRQTDGHSNEWTFRWLGVRMTT